MLVKKFLKTKNECEVTFKFDAQDADNVALLTEANDWIPVPMKKYRGVYSTKMRFPKNSNYRFRYLVDGEAWENDEAADAYWPNSFGGDNSILSTFEK